MRVIQNTYFEPSQVLSILQFQVHSEPLLPNLETLDLSWIYGGSLPFIPLLLSPRTTTINLHFAGVNLHKVTAASIITAFPALCPNLRDIRLSGLPKVPAITLAVSELVLNTNKNTLQSFIVESPLTKAACEVIYQHPDLRTLRTAIDWPTALPAVVLPNIHEIIIDYYDGYNQLQGFCGTSLGKLASITIFPHSDSIDGFLEEFGNVSLTTSIPATLSTFEFSTSRSLRPSYRSLLPFTSLKVSSSNSPANSVVHQR
jgi:hypothetical protein